MDLDEANEMIATKCDGEFGDGRKLRIIKDLSDFTHDDAAESVMKLYQDE